jgi:hypothetical protein
MAAARLTALALLIGHAAALPQRQAPAAAPLLHPQAFVPLPVGSIRPDGWLLEQLKLQAEGLSGHLAMFYPSIADSWWVGGIEAASSTSRPREHQRPHQDPCSCLLSRSRCHGPLPPALTDTRVVAGTG